jgi:hypothetical protein
MKVYKKQIIVMLTIWKSNSELKVLSNYDT